MITNNIAVNAKIEKSFVGILKYVFINKSEGTLATMHTRSCPKIFLNFSSITYARVANSLFS